MKIKISKSKAGETRVDYMKIFDVTQFRFRLLQKIIGNFDNNAFLFIDTNRCTRRNCGPDILERLRLAGLEPLVLKIPADKEQFFGIQVNMWNKNDIEYVICLEMKGSPLTKEVFDILSVCDVAAGFNQIEPVVNEYGIAGVNPTLLLKTCFKNQLYDSLLCSRVNSNFDISRYVEEITHEMGL